MQPKRHQAGLNGAPLIGDRFHWLACYFQGIDASSCHGISLQLSWLAYKSALYKAVVPKKPQSSEICLKLEGPVEWTSALQEAVMRG